MQLFCGKWHRAGFCTGLQLDLNFLQQTDEPSMALMTDAPEMQICRFPSISRDQLPFKFASHPQRAFGSILMCTALSSALSVLRGFFESKKPAFVKLSSLIFTPGSICRSSFATFWFRCAVKVMFFSESPVGLAWPKSEILYLRISFLCFFRQLQKPRFEPGCLIRLRNAEFVAKRTSIVKVGPALGGSTLRVIPQPLLAIVDALVVSDPEAVFVSVDPYCVLMASFVPTNFHADVGFARGLAALAGSFGFRTVLVCMVAATRSRFIPIAPYFPSLPTCKYPLARGVKGCCTSPPRDICDTLSVNSNFPGWAYHKARGSSRFAKGKPGEGKPEMR